MKLRKKLEKQAKECCAVLYNLRGLPLVSNLNELHLIQIQKDFKTINVKTVNVFMASTAAGKNSTQINSEEGKIKYLQFIKTLYYQKLKFKRYSFIIETKIYDKLNIPISYEVLKLINKWIMQRIIMIIHFAKQSESGLRQFWTCPCCSFIIQLLSLNQNSRIAFEEGFLRLFLIQDQIAYQFQSTSKLIKYLNSQISQKYWFEDIKRQQAPELLKQFVSQLQANYYSCFLKLEKDGQFLCQQIVDCDTKYKLRKNRKLIKTLEWIIIFQFRISSSIIERMKNEEHHGFHKKLLKIQIPQISVSKQKLRSFRINNQKSTALSSILKINQKRKLVIYFGLNKNADEPFGFYDPIDGIEYAVDPDTIGYQQMINNPEDVIQLRNMIDSITSYIPKLQFNLKKSQQFQ